MTDFGKKVGKGVEEAPIEVPSFAPIPQPEKSLPGLHPDFTPVPVKLPEPVRR